MVPIDRIELSLEPYHGSVITIILNRHLAPTEGFEPPSVLPPIVFKTTASTALPRRHLIIILFLIFTFILYIIFYVMSIVFYILIITFGRPNGIRIRVCAVTVRYPRPLDDRTIMVGVVGVEPTMFLM